MCRRRCCIGKIEKNLAGEDAWANGKIHVLERTPGCSCFREVTMISPIITGLPMSNYDHAGSGLVFHNDGALRIQVGGFTNAGHIQDSQLGGVGENPLSAANLTPRVEDVNFNGRTRYQPLTPSSARKVSGDVELHMAGLRNSFGLMFTVVHKRSADFVPVDERYYVDKLELLRKRIYANHSNRNRGRTNSSECRL